MIESSNKETKIIIFWLRSQEDIEEWKGQMESYIPLILSKSLLISCAQPWQCIFTLSTTTFTCACLTTFSKQVQQKNTTQGQKLKAWDLYVDETLSSFLSASFVSLFSSLTNFGEMSSAFLLYFFLSVPKTFNGSTFSPLTITLSFALSTSTSWTPNKIITYTRDYHAKNDIKQQCNVRNESKINIWMIITIKSSQAFGDFVFASFTMYVYFHHNFVTHWFSSSLKIISQR